MATKAATAKWAQRADTIFLRFEVLESNDVKVEFTEDSLTFTATNKGAKYSNQIDFFKNINTEDSGYQVKGRSIDCLIYKQDLKDIAFWPRLCKEKKKVFWLSVDFNRWRDEDDSEDEGNSNFNQDFDFSKLMNSQGGMNTMNGEANFDPTNINMDDIDSDDEDLPNLNEIAAERKKIAAKEGGKGEGAKEGAGEKGQGGVEEKSKQSSK